MYKRQGPQQKWIIENLLGNAIAELDGYPYAIGLKNKNLIESKVVHPESEYDYVDRFDDDEADLLNYNCRYSYSKPDLKESKKESKNISAEQKLMKKDAVKKEPFLITKEMIAVEMCIRDRIKEMSQPMPYSEKAIKERYGNAKNALFYDDYYGSVNYYTTDQRFHGKVEVSLARGPIYGKDEDTT